MVFRDLDKQALKQNAYTVLSKITLLNDNSVFTEDDFIVDWTYEDYRYVPDNGFIGQFVERLLDGNLQNIPDNKIFENQEINLKIGIVNGIDNQTTWYDYGNFLITKVKKEDTTGKYTFESADYTKKFNKVFDGNYTDTTYTKSFNQKIEDEETVTALWLAQYVCKQAGVVLYTTNFTNADFVISSNQYDSEDTLRKVMQDIGKLAYSWVRVAEDNKVHIDFTPKTTSSVDQYDQLSTDEYYVSKKSDLTFGPVNKVLIGMSSIEGENLYETSEDYTEETECAIKIYDNNLTNTEELRELALNGCERLFGIEYTPIEIETIGHPWLEGDELIKLTNVDNEILYTYPFNRKITYAGYIKGTIGAEATTTQDSEYEYKSDVINSVKKTTVIVDKQNQTITGLVEDVGENTSNITTLQESVGGISATVEALDNNIQDVTDQVNSVLQAEKTIKGNPVTIEDSGEYLIKNISFYGNLEQETEEEEAGTTIQVNGSATLTDVDTTKESRVLRLLGQTSQSTYSGKNLFNVATSTTKKYVNKNTGNIGTSDDWSASDFIPVAPNTTYIFSGITNGWSNSAGHCFYKSDKTFISSVASNVYSFTTPSETSYVRLSLNSETPTSVQFEKGSSATSYEPYVGGTSSPNPSYPQPVNVVSGDNYINICGKNLFSLDKFKSDNPSATITGNDESFYYSYSNVVSYINYNFEENQQYTISGSWSTTNGNFRVRVAFTDGTFQTLFENYSTSSANGSFNKISIVNKTINKIEVMTWSSGNITFNNFQIEKGSTATTYEPYIGQSYPIYLGVENLFTTTLEQNARNNTDGTTTIWSTNYIRTKDKIKVEPNTTYYISYEANSSFNGGDIQFYQADSTYLNNIALGSTPKSFTTPSNAYYINIQWFRNGGIATTDITNLQLTKGSTPQHISTTPIELCKIGTYQDYIYKENGSWYLHKEIGKVVLDGTETWTRTYVSGSGSPCYWSLFTTLGLPTPKYEADSKICNYFPYEFKIWNYSSTNTLAENNANDLSLLFNVDSSIANTISEWNTWLSTHGVIVYYVLATPTNTLIEDTTLISQLDALESQ